MDKIVFHFTQCKNQFLSWPSMPPVRLVFLTLIAQILLLFYLSFLHNCPRHLYNSRRIWKSLLQTFSHPGLFLPVAHQVNSFETFKCSLNYHLPSEAYLIENCNFPTHSPTPYSAPFSPFSFIIFKYILYFTYLLSLLLSHQTINSLLVGCFGLCGFTDILLAPRITCQCLLKK